jgi:hypothetical protein
MLPVKIRAFVIPVKIQAHSIHNQENEDHGFSLVNYGHGAPKHKTRPQSSQISTKYGVLSVSNTAHSTYSPLTRLIQLPNVWSGLTHIFYKWNISSVIFIFINSSCKLMFSLSYSSIADVETFATQQRQTRTHKALLRSQLQVTEEHLIVEVTSVRMSVKMC